LVEIFVKNTKKNFKHTAKILPKVSFIPLPRNRKKTKRFHSVMTSITVFTQNQNPSNFVRI